MLLLHGYHHHHHHSHHHHHFSRFRNSVAYFKGKLKCPRICPVIKQLQVCLLYLYSSHRYNAFESCLLLSYKWKTCIHSIVFNQILVVFVTCPNCYPRLWIQILLFFVCSFYIRSRSITHAMNIPKILI